MKLIVFSGFLGAGKTMAILSLAGMLMRGRREGRTRLVIVENEIGAAGIDDKVLGQAGYEVRSLLSGCICCTLSTDLASTLGEIAQSYDPDYVIFEPSGVAFPDRIIGTIRSFVAPVEWITQVTVVDAKRWKRLMAVTPELAAAQVQNADTLLLNKCDLVSAGELEQVEQALRRINARAVIRRVVATDAIPDQIWREAVGTDA